MKKSKTLPSWLSDALGYQIYPQSFSDSNNDGTGDLPGIIDKLDYLKWLGVNLLWINPIFTSPFLDAGYDVADYYEVAERYGTKEDLGRLLQEAHRRGIRVLLDLVAGHTSVEHEWFKESSREEIKKIIRYWLDFGIDGFRVDMASSLVKGDLGWKETSKFWRETRKMMEKEYPEAVLISEWGSPADFMLQFDSPDYTSLFRYEKGRNTTNEFIGKSYFHREAEGRNPRQVRRKFFPGPG